MHTKVQKWGNSLALRIPRSFAAEAQVEEGSTVDVSVENMLDKAGAATVTILLIASYSVFVLGGFWEGTLIGTALGAVYGFLYLLLRLEDYALLAGSIGLFAMLALVMLLTRRVNWYDLKLGAANSTA